MINLMFTPYAVMECDYFKNCYGACENIGGLDLDRINLPEGHNPSCPHFPKSFFESEKTQRMMTIHSAFGTLCYRLQMNDPPLIDERYKAVDGLCRYSEKEILCNTQSPGCQVFCRKRRETTRESDIKRTQL